jgi:uncharacterized protein YbbC (DUF1343 family)
LKKMIMEGKTALEIETSWQTDLDSYKKLRERYLIYK